jgi:hypothetical protein
MKKKLSVGGQSVWAAGIVAVLVMAGCAAKTTSPGVAGTPAPRAAVKSPAGLVLEYKMPEGQVLKYEEKQEAREVGEVMGQTRESLSVATDAVSFSAKGLRGKDYLLGVTIDDMTMSVTNAGGDLSPDLSSVRGKSFDMVLSPLGNEVDVSGAEAITFEMVNGTRSVASGFKLFFPDLPDRAIKVGDSWPSSEAVEDKTGSTNIRLEFKTVNTLEGFEAVDGMECARVSSETTGTISGTGSQEGADLLFGGTIKGTGIWHFAVKEGLLVSSTSDSVTEMTISVTGPMNLTIPMTQTRKDRVKLVGR